MSVKHILYSTIATMNDIFCDHVLANGKEAVISILLHNVFIHHCQSFSIHCLIIKVALLESVWFCVAGAFATQLLFFKKSCEVVQIS